MRLRLAALVIAAFSCGCSGETTAPAVDAGGAGGADAGPDQSVPSDDAAPDASGDVSRRDGFIDIFDALPIPDGQAGACAACVRDNCGTQVNECVNSDVCRNGLVCTFMTCLAGGGMPDLACILGCFNGDTSAAFAAVGALMCVQTSCGSICTPSFEGGMPIDASTTDAPPADAPNPSDATPADANSTGDGATDDGSPPASD
jgi:hypothetical protein